MKIKDLRALSDQELNQKEVNLREELFKLNQQRFASRVEKPHMFSLIKKDIARIKSILKERKETKNG
ncbi:MAG: 50S ribosomal protein L29 [Candidatus Omnitrophota bacterium]|jgi:large subunit ribosomal protein L29|nr:MAG: 50S ribosomal protein L29 [Candidatus Omnitrophota bacterium]